MITEIILLALAVGASSVKIHTHTAAPHCVDLQCPAIAIDLGVRDLINDETMSREQCQSCSQCTAHGYSVCMRMPTSRDARSRSCACAHATPANCHNEVSKNARPVNITMNLFTICYLSSLQAPPKPLAVHEKSSIIVTIDSFWTEPYWKLLELSNLTLHYQYIVSVPEHCDGEVTTHTHDMGAPVHTCEYSKPIDMKGPVEGETKHKTNDDYEHSENYDTYDDELPPEVQFDREIFEHAREVKFFYRVTVRRPRQITKDNSADPFRDIVTEVDSETLHFELRPYKRNLKNDEHEEEKNENNDEGSEEFPEETDFFAGDKKEEETKKKLREQVLIDKEKLDGHEHHTDITESEELAREEESVHLTTEAAKEEGEEKENKVTEEEKGKEEEKDKEEEEIVEEETEEEKKEDEEDGNNDDVAPTEEEITQDLLTEKSTNATEILEDALHNGNSTEIEDGSTKLEPNESAEVEKEIEKESEDEKREEEEEEEEGTTVDREEEEETTGDDQGIQEVEASTAEGEKEEKDKNEEGEQDIHTLLSTWFNPSDNMGLARLVFILTLVLCLLVIVITCFCKHETICGKKETKTAGGYTYNAATQQTRPLVVEPEREPFNQ